MSAKLKMFDGKEPEETDLRREDVLEDLDKILAHGFGKLTVEVNGYRIVQLDASTRRRKRHRAGK